MKASIKEAEAKLKSLQLTAYDFGNKSVFVLQHGGAGSTFLFSCAFTLKWKDWYLVYTEHDGDHVYHEDDADVVVFVREDVQPFSKFRRDPRTIEFFRKGKK